MENILEQFPGRQSEIEQFCHESADFRELCQDYQEVRTLIATWTDSHGSDQVVIDDYQTLLQELEEDIREYLQVSLEPAKQSGQDSAAHPIQFEEEDDEVA